MVVVNQYEPVGSDRGWLPARRGLVALIIGLAVAMGAWPAQASEPLVPLAPEEPVAAKAFAVLDQHCARCHQNGKLKGLRPARSFGNVLDLKALAGNPALVQPGNPDGSRLYTMMLSRAMPFDVAQEQKGQEPTAADLAAVRDWVQGLSPAPACADRKLVNNRDQQDTILRVLNAAGDNARQLRFISFNHFHNACVPATEIKALTDAATRLINSLSTGAEPIALAAINDEKTVLQVNLASIGWDAPRWERLAAIYPYGAASLVEAGIETATGSKAAVIRGDWLADVATQAPLYYELLALPDRLQALQSSLQVDLIGDVASVRARRFGIKTSAIARGSRLGQRHAISTGAYWTTLEYAPTPGRADPFDTPIGPGARGSLKPDANLVMFNLPNGFNAFFIANTDGVRVNDLPQSVLRNEARPGHRIAAGLACMSCHDNGPREATDELRPRLQQDTTLVRDIRDRLLTLHGTAEEQQKLISDDAQRLKRAYAAAGIAPDLTIAGLPPVEALAARYKRGVDATTAAGELGVDAAALGGLSEKSSGVARDLLDRLHTGVVPRAEFEARFALLVAALAGGNRPQAAAASTLAPAAPEVASELELVLKTDKQTFKPGDLLTVKARASANCFLTLVSVDRNGRGTVIYPNDFEQNNLLEVGKEVQVPSPSAAYQFRLRDKGRETVIGVCAPTQRSADGIKHDFERLRFTELGDYRAFLGRTWATELDERRGVATRGDPRAKRAARNPVTPGAAAPASTARYEPQARTAIQIDVK